MKAPVTTQDLLLLAESELSGTNVRNCDKRTQTTSIFIVITTRTNHGGELPKHLGAPPWSSALQTSPVFSRHYSKGKGWAGEAGERGKEKGTKTKH